MPSPGPGGVDELPGGDELPSTLCTECCIDPESYNCLACTDSGIPCPAKGAPPEGFTAPKLKGVHFLASNPSKAVVLTFTAATNEGGEECGGFCECSLLLDAETVAKLKVGPARSPAACACHAAARNCRLPAVATGR